MKCHEKAKYFSKKQAEEIALKSLTERNVKLEAYCCPQCANWHLTHWKASTHPWAQTAEETVEIWLKSGIEMVRVCIKRKTISKSVLGQAIKLIENDQKIPELWKLAEVSLLKEEWRRL